MAFLLAAGGSKALYRNSELKGYNYKRISLVDTKIKPNVVPGNCRDKSKVSKHLNFKKGFQKMFKFSVSDPYTRHSKGWKL